MSAATLVLGAIGLFVGLQVLVLVLLLLERVHRPLREIKRYADDILAAGVGIARNLDAVDEAVTTRELARALPDALRKAVA
jgi:hypothetical protein